MLETVGDHSFQLLAVNSDGSSKASCSLYLDWESRECWLNVADPADWGALLSALGAELGC